MIIDIKRVLVSTDFTETSNYAVEKGCRIASLFNAELFLIHIFESSPYKLVTPDDNPNSNEKVVLQKNVMDRFEKMGKDITERYQIDVNTLLGETKVVKVITDAVKDNAIDLIVMGTNGASGVKEFLIGSNAQNVVNAAPCPVVTIKAAPVNQGFDTIVMPVQSWNSSLEKLDYVSSIAGKFKSLVHILGIMENNKKEEVDKVLSLVDSAEKYLQDAGIACVKEISTSQVPANEILLYSQKIKADLIMVMAGHESHMGTVIPFVFAKHIINHSEIPVMSIKPLMYHSEKVSFHLQPVHRSDNIRRNY